MSKHNLSLIFIVLLFNCTVIQPIRMSPNSVYVENIEAQPFDAIIVPGVPYYGVSWSSVMRTRVYWSKFLFDKGYAKNIIYTGGAVYSPYVESEIMSLFAQELGIPKENIYIEDKAEHSAENVYYSFHMARELGFTNIALASDPYQTNNLRRYIEKNNLPYKFLPVLYDTIVTFDLVEPTINAKLALIDTSSFVSIRERESFFKRLRGTFGKNIEYSKEDIERKNGGAKKKD